MTSKAEKRRRKRGCGGRPRRSDVAREPNGKPSRRRADRSRLDAMTEAEARSVALEARMRHTGLPAELAILAVAGGPNAGTPHGVLRLQGHLSEDQWAAAEFYIGLRHAWVRSIDAPDRPIEPTEIFGEGTEDGHAAWCDHIRERWDALLAAIEQASTEQRSPIKAALDEILIRESPHLDHLFGDLRVALNAIHRHRMASASLAA